MLKKKGFKLFGQLRGPGLKNTFFTFYSSFSKITHETDCNENEHQIPGGHRRSLREN